jgi:hypothetical protein
MLIEVIEAASTSTLSKEQMTAVIERVGNAIRSDRANAERGATKATESLAKAGVDKVDKEGKVSWSERTSTKLTSAKTGALMIEAAIAFQQDGIRRGLFAPNSLPTLADKPRQWLEGVIARVLETKP